MKTETKSEKNVSCYFSTLAVVDLSPFLIIIIFNFPVRCLAQHQEMPFTDACL